MPKSQIADMENGQVVVSTYKNNVLLAKAAPNIEVMPDGRLILGCMNFSPEVVKMLLAAPAGRIQDGYVIHDQRAVEKVQTKELEKTLTRWEGAVSACERDGDDSPEAEQELTDSRRALITLLKQALAGCV